MARRLKEKEITPDIFITSPAKRTSRTCREFARVFNFPKTAIKKVEELYHASPETILKVLQRINEKYDLVLLFGHNPGLTEFAEWLTSKNLLNIPTCGIVGIKLQIKFWKDIDPGKARLLLFDFPKKYNGRNGN